MVSVKCALGNITVKLSIIENVFRNLQVEDPIYLIFSYAVLCQVLLYLQETCTKSCVIGIC